ncbi:MAG: 3-isopropylmalate dehydratase small subunit [bacterium]|nr:3-isopropylmalate dehydratase small subunit [bacterium]
MFKGRVLKFGDNVNTDEIIPAIYLDTISPSDLAKHCMEGIDPEFPKKVKKGDIIVAMKNFGCGSSREHAPLAIKTLGISCVVACSFARIFYRNAINIGLPILESPGAAEETKEGDWLEIDIEKGTIRNARLDRIYNTIPFPTFMQKIIDAGGLMEYVKEKVRREDV